MICQLSQSLTKKDVIMLCFNNNGKSKLWAFSINYWLCHRRRFKAGAKSHVEDKQLIVERAALKNLMIKDCDLFVHLLKGDMHFLNLS